MAKSNLWSEQNKKKFAVGAVLVCDLVVVYEFFLSGGPSPQPRSTAQSSNARPGPTAAPAVTPTPKGATPVRQDSAAAKEAQLQAQLLDTSPLTLMAQKPVVGEQTE